MEEKEPYDIISEVVSINFVDFNMDFGDAGKPHRCFKLIDTENPDIVLDMVQRYRKRNEERFTGRKKRRTN